jgi:glycosyltransferase involved in cell wall biosynthesis
MPGGVDMASFVPAERRTPDPTILFSAALDQPQKGGAVLLEAFAILLRTVPNARLWLSGPGDPSATLGSAPSAVREHAEVLPIGDAHAQNERYGRAWVTTLPSKTDSFGLVMIESLACGTPVAASNHSALPELVIEGENGYLCDPDDPSSVAEALRAAIDLAATPGIVERCRAIAEPYDWDEGIAPMYERIYERNG